MAHPIGPHPERSRRTHDDYSEIKSLERIVSSYLLLVIARSAATKQSRASDGAGLLRFARNDGRIVRFDPIML